MQRSVILHVKNNTSKKKQSLKNDFEKRAVNNISYSCLLTELCALPHDFSILSGDVAEQHHRVQLHAALMELLLWDLTELHRGT